MEYHSKILAFSVNLLYKYHNLDKRNQSPIYPEPVEGSMLSSTLSAAEGSMPKGDFGKCLMPMAAGSRESANLPRFMGNFDPVLQEEAGFCFFCGR